MWARSVRSRLSRPDVQRKGTLMKRKLTPLIAGAPIAFALIASGCGVAAGATPYGAAAASATKTAAGAANVKTADSSIGRILVDGKGRTLYLFEKDRNHRSTCYG